MSAIPCKQPKVVISPVGQETPDGRPWTAMVVNCHVPGCKFNYKAAVITDANWQASRHRSQHRDAVLASETFRHSDGGFGATCACSWAWGPGTRTDAMNQLTSHQSSEHGLVTC